MKILRVVLTLVVGLYLASPLLAAPNKKADKVPPCPATQRVNQIVKNLTLTADQTAKFDALEKEFGPKMVEAKKQLEEAKKQIEALNKGLSEKVMDVLTAEQKEQLKPKKAEKKATKKGAKVKDADAVAPAATK